MIYYHPKSSKKYQVHCRKLQFQDEYLRIFQTQKLTHHWKLSVGNISEHSFEKIEYIVVSNNPNIIFYHRFIDDMCITLKSSWVRKIENAFNKFELKFRFKFDKYNQFYKEFGQSYLDKFIYINHKNWTFVGSEQKLHEFPECSSIRMAKIHSQRWIRACYWFLHQFKRNKELYKQIQGNIKEKRIYYTIY